MFRVVVARACVPEGSLDGPGVTAGGGESAGVDVAEVVQRHSVTPARAQARRHWRPTVFWCGG